MSVPNPNQPLLGVNPVHPDIIKFANSMNGTEERRKAFLQQFEGWSDEKQHEMADAIVIRKFERFAKGCQEILKPKPKWWERMLSWIGL